MRSDPRSLTRAVLWLGSASALSRALDFAAIVLVIGLVSPDEVGRASLAWTMVALSEPFANLGVGSGLLSMRQVDRLTLDSALWLALFGGVCSALLLVWLAPLLAWLVSAPSVAPLIALSALKLVPAAVATVPQQRLARALRQRELAAAGTLSTLISAALRVGLALGGFGAYAFVVAQIGYSLTLLGLCGWLAPWRPKLRVDQRRAHALLSLGLPATSSTGLGQWARNVDYLFVGAFMGMEALGLYRVAFDLAMEPVGAVGEVVARGAAATLRKLAHSPAALQQGFKRATGLVLASALPIGAIVFALAPSLLALLKDASFAPAASAARWLVVAAVLRALLGLYTPLAMAIGRPGLSLRSSLEMLVLLSSALALSLTALGRVLSIAAAGLAWCAALGVSLALTRLRFRSALRAPPRLDAKGMPR
ncbi:MAG TPA: oligosaccharide flippase family protein [Polyangiales bacterium]